MSEHDERSIPHAGGMGLKVVEFICKWSTANGEGRGTSSLLPEEGDPTINVVAMIHQRSNMGWIGLGKRLFRMVFDDRGLHPPSDTGWQMRCMCTNQRKRPP